MKYLTLMKQLFILLLLFCSNAYSQEKQLIIRVPAQSEKSIQRISKQLSQVDGVHFSGYVKHASCLLLRYDGCVLKNEEIITTLIHHLNSKLKFEVINGYTAFDVIDGRFEATEAVE